MNAKEAAEIAKRVKGSKEKVGRLDKKDGSEPSSPVLQNFLEGLCEIKDKRTIRIGLPSTESDYEKIAAKIIQLEQEAIADPDNAVTITFQFMQRLKRVTPVPHDFIRDLESLIKFGHNSRLSGKPWQFLSYADILQLAKDNCIWFNENIVLARFLSLSSLEQLDVLEEIIQLGKPRQEEENVYGYFKSVWQFLRIAENRQKIKIFLSAKRLSGCKKSILPLIKSMKVVAEFGSAKYKEEENDNESE